MKLRFDYKKGKKLFEEKTENSRKELLENVSNDFKSGITGYEIARTYDLSVDLVYYM